MSALTPEPQVEAMREAMRWAASGFRNLVEFELIPKAYEEEALLQADILENAASSRIDTALIAMLRGQSREAAAARKGHNGSL